jgi:hypothetical protein
LPSALLLWTARCQEGMREVGRINRGMESGGGETARPVE